MTIQIDAAMETEDGAAFLLSADEQSATIKITDMDGEEASGIIRFHRHEVLTSIYEAVSYCETDAARGPGRHRYSTHQFGLEAVVTVATSNGRTHLACHDNGRRSVFPIHDEGVSLSLRRDLREAAALLKKTDDAAEGRGR